MSRKTDVQPIGASLYVIPVETRVPLKFGTETLTHINCARVCLTVRDINGKTAEGWGETPLSVQWVWPSELSYEERYSAMEEFCHMLTCAWTEYDKNGHPIEIGHSFIEEVLPGLLEELNSKRGKGVEPMPWLAALVCCSAFDIALHDAYGNLHGRYVYETYISDFMNFDLSYYLTPAEESKVSFEGKYPIDFLNMSRPQKLAAWHLVGGKDLLESSELTGTEPDDGYPVLLLDWIERDGLTCLKIKLRGNDKEWDYDRIVKVGKIAIEHGASWLTCDFNCTVTDPAYVTEILDRLVIEEPRIYGMILYVEQPFPYDLEENQIDAHSVSARKPLFMDESAHDWHLIKLGQVVSLGGQE